MLAPAALLAVLLAPVQAPPTGAQASEADSGAAATTDVPTVAMNRDREAAVLAALERTPDAGAIAVRAQALHFPREGGQSLVTVVADLPLAGPTLRTVPGEGGTFTQNFTVLALIRDEAGQVAQKLSRHYLLSWSEEDLEEVRTERVLFSREAVLSPGRYSIDVAVRDAEDGKMGVARLPLDLPPAPADQFRVSSLVVVGHAEPQVLGAPGPLYLDGVRFYPSLGDAVELGDDQTLAFLFTLRPGTRSLASATLALLREGETVLQSPIALPSPDETGQMRVVGGLPLGEREPGPYILRLSVNNAQGLQTRSTPFSLAPRKATSPRAPAPSGPR